ncbi:hypothetical protein QLX08_004522 [Tetragonisca angustula]|uniref:Uncharacterized protein n=1 Tax=Tetragonisca angustula TaxID=166442 RepID=A0AAW1A2E0_9HYME
MLARTTLRQERIGKTLLQIYKETLKIRIYFITTITFMNVKDRYNMKFRVRYRKPAFLHHLSRLCSSNVDFGLERVSPPRRLFTRDLYTCPLYMQGFRPYYFVLYAILSIYDFVYHDS